MDIDPEEPQCWYNVGEFGTSLSANIKGPYPG